MSNKILMAHGNGGKHMARLINEIIIEILGPESIQSDDSAILNLEGRNIVFTTDTYTITPLFFQGGNIGDLAINGTVNDLAVMGAEPLYLSCGLVIEEGLEIKKFKKILRSMKKSADSAGVTIVTGDTKVVDKGSADKIFINTSGIGILKGDPLRGIVKTGDKVIINGTVGDHGISIMAERNNLSFTEGLTSDSAPLNHLIKKISQKFPQKIKFARDATRGGVASVLNELAESQEYGIRLDEDKIPVRDEVKGVSEILGIDPLYSANEGKVILVVDKTVSDLLLSEMKSIETGKESTEIGEITSEYPGKVYLRTAVGGNRIIPPLEEDQLPRIC